MSGLFVLVLLAVLFVVLAGAWAVGYSPAKIIKGGWAWLVAKFKAKA